MCDYYGQAILSGSVGEDETLIIECDFEALGTHRRMWPFFRDRRIDTYSALEKRSLEDC